MEQIQRISSSLSEPWVAWLMFALLVILFAADHLQQGIITSAFRSLKENKDRKSIFNNTQQSILGQILLFVYKIIVTTLLFYTLFNQSIQWPFTQILWVMLIILSWIIIKSLINLLLCFVFFSSKTFQIAQHQYSNLTTCCTVIIYPILLFALFLPQVGLFTIQLFSGITIIFYLFVLTIKLFRVFFSDLLAGINIFLYLCTLELIPLLAIIYIGNHLFN